MLKFELPLSTCESGVGNDLAIARPTGFRRLAGIWLPGKGRPVRGSLTTTCVPLRNTPLKLPASSAAVGTRNVACCGWLSTYFSPATQKKVLFFQIGPPPPPPPLRQYSGTLGWPSSFGISSSLTVDSGRNTP